MDKGTLTNLSVNIPYYLEAWTKDPYKSITKSIEYSKPYMDMEDALLATLYQITLGISFKESRHVIRSNQETIENIMFK